MESIASLLIAIDAGHGGWDNGATFEGRLEKDDNLRLALEVRQQLEALGVKVLMTRETDIYVTLQDRAAIANQADADLFISLHRNSYFEQTSWTMGVENYIYLTAPEETSGKAAALVLDAVAAVGVQANRGVNRGNYYVLRRTIMPSMLLEMGYIINEEDNRLFDENLVAYARAIAMGALAYFGVYIPLEPEPCPEQPPCLEQPSACPPPVCPPASCPELPPFFPPVQKLIAAGQQALNTYFGANIAADGVFGPQTRTAIIRALQKTLNEEYDKNLAVDGVLGPQTIAAIPNYAYGDAGPGVRLVQIMLAVRGYDPGPIDGMFGNRTRAAVMMFQRDCFLTPDGVAGPLTIARLLA